MSDIRELADVIDELETKNARLNDFLRVIRRELEWGDVETACRRVAMMVDSELENQKFANQFESYLGDLEERLEVEHNG